MDPNETIRRIIALIENPKRGENPNNPYWEQKDEFEELCEALYDWLQRGGFRPERVVWPLRGGRPVRSLWGEFYAILPYPLELPDTSGCEWRIHKYNMSGNLTGSVILWGEESQS